MIKPPKILVIKSDTTELKKVEDFLKEAFEEFQLSKSDFNRIYLCVSEAVVNSIEHGNNWDKNKEVTIEISCDNAELNIIVKDEGEGYNVENILDPTVKNNIKNESGRGIHIIKSYCDRFELEKNKSFIRFKMNCL